MPNVREPAVAGTFYPRNTKQLREELKRLLAEASPEEPAPKALVAPHAGYPYSGPIAAQAYARLAQDREAIRRVLLIGPAHHGTFRGLAACHAEGWATPLGIVPVDRPALEQALRLPQVCVLDQAHDEEHSLEVHLPFLQTVLENFSVLPLLVGETLPEEVAEVLESLWGGSETRIVVSSDLSHYLDYETARKTDQQTQQTIETLEADRLVPHQACGYLPVGGLGICARRRKMKVRTIDLRNSGDTAGSRDRVVGYGAFLFYE